MVFMVAPFAWEFPCLVIGVLFKCAIYPAELLFWRPA